MSRQVLLRASVSRLERSIAVVDLVRTELWNSPYVLPDVSHRLALAVEALLQVRESLAEAQRSERPGTHDGSAVTSARR